MTKLYSVDVRFYGTLYIKAENEIDALNKARRCKNNFLDADRAMGGDFEVNGDQFDTMAGDDIPEITLSPNLTCHGPDKNEEPSLCTDFDDEEEAA